MSREKLLDISSKFLTWINAHGADPAELKSIVADDLVLKVPYPGQTPDLAGLLQHHKMACAAASDFKLTLLKAVVDEVECTVVHFLECSGTHGAYRFTNCGLILVNGRESLPLGKSSVSSGLQ
jgi:hypothetical protein